MATNPSLWTSARQTEMYLLFQVLFNGAPGTTYMGQLYDSVTSGMSTEQIYETYTSSAQFTSLYPKYMSNRDFATKIVSTVIGASASEKAKAQASLDLEAALNVGWTRGKAVYSLFSNLSVKQNDVDWGGTAKLISNKIAVARFYTEELLVSETDYSALRQVIANVTKDTSVETEAQLAATVASAFYLPDPSLRIASNQVSVNEGATATFTVSTGAAPDTWLLYTLSGVSTLDVTDGYLIRNAKIGSNGQAIISIFIAADRTTEGNEILTVTVQGKPATTTIVDTST
jgi:hypothetical protein